MLILILISCNIKIYSKNIRNYILKTQSNNFNICNITTMKESFEVKFHFYFLIKQANFFNPMRSKSH